MREAEGLRQRAVSARVVLDRWRWSAPMPTGVVPSGFFIRLQSQGRAEAETEGLVFGRIGA